MAVMMRQCVGFRKWIGLVATLGLGLGLGLGLPLGVGCRSPSPHVGGSGDDSLVEEIGLWAQVPPQLTETYYVRPPGQSYGVGDGSRWSNALSGLPEELVRGARYFLAAGDYHEGPPPDRYHSHVLDDPEDGELVIGLFKATVTEHGDATDWQDSFADGAARLGPLAIVTGYYLIDGREGAVTGDYGFEVHTRDCARRAGAAAGAPVTFPYDSLAHHVSLQQMDIADCGSQDDPALPAQDAMYGIAPVSQLALRDCTVRDAWRNLLFFEDAFDVLVERNHFARAGRHHEANAVALRNARNVVIRRNTFTDAANTFLSLQGTRNVIVSANVFQRASDDWDVWAAIWSDAPALNVLVAGNTFFNLAGLNTGVRFDGPTTHLRVVNNLWALCRANQIQLDGDHDHNAYYDNWRVDGDTPVSLDELIEEPTAQVFTEDPFVDAAGYDLGLAVPTESGASVLEPFVGVDLAGLSRGRDGVWDRGAYEYRAPE